MRYWKITCMRGHAGMGKHTDITFVFQAKSLLDAEKLAKRMPSVKHTRGILCGKEISFEEYIERKSLNAYELAEGRATLY